ncbi:hypothetical protein GUITHDRAFT_73869 [Guillardia theta CCMP2712]|uniref:Tyr recombinase domain-containing protein n=1 Tax=Guillardia theta (strain CCMP2712) TaxID=905079 RepID=L1I536_GUITC|nr:hypothetical protein GUITHDRAFT_83509 [Guillardia theta CCMP2712]XP_005829527.1 hypothetical protein GUITHDRAFT_73869 [Guillardia theta CCMP2712]EKX31004.1 hypothetical protein GUITHDRAFT_83509 [Guillardia theta CCMP2712]EKX42547.1 hypothetical protein GUITHDRAFT_73869 [Guillardia theta CCMP2712]|eukprot:XP_005817984.1 hypothetical protein GUITHDRAFT_83509 [Guillardia theta CCMP2712]
MEFFEDALKIYIIHQKNDQEGDRPRDGKHIYANPLNPDICPLLALGIYWCCFGMNDNGHGKLFPGNNQFDRFSKIITRFRNNENLKDAFKFLGIDIQNIGSHSVRKGSATYCSGGSPDGPRYVPLSNR